MRVPSQTIATALEPSLIGVPEKQNALLFDIASRSKHPGALVKMQPLDCVVVDAAPGDELAYHIHSLIDRNLLETRNSIYEAVITSHGWEYIESLRNPKSGNRSDIFVAMLFAEELQSAWIATRITTKLMIG
jgi:hypothetical protein